MQVLEPVALQRTQIIDVSQFAAQLLKNFPVSVASDDPVRLFQVLFKMSLHAIVVDERVVNVEQEDDVRHFAHRTRCLTAFACRELFSDRPEMLGITFQFFLPLPRSCLAISVTRSGSNPYFRSSSLSGADAPNVFMPMTRPDLPT